MEKKFKFKNIHDSNFNNYYSDYLNMYNYYKDGIVIVGVIDDEADDITKDIYIRPSVWTNIVADNCKYYCTESILLPREGDYNYIVSSASKNNIQFDE